MDKTVSTMPKCQITTNRTGVTLQKKSQNKIKVTIQCNKTMNLSNEYQ